MTNILLGYLCVGITLVGVYCVREWRNASSYRDYVRPLFTDMQEANLLLLEAELPKEADHVVARRHGQDERRDEEHLKAQLAHDLMVVARSEGAAIR